jgi:EmrB/QacA subfamily drug resistance transporter
MSSLPLPASPAAVAAMPGTQRWILALTALASFMVALDAMVVTTALGAIRIELHASVAELEWIVNAYNLSFAVLLLTGAALGDRFGRRRILIAGLGLFVAASLGCALAPGTGWLIAARALQGVGAALVMPLAMVMLGTAFTGAARAKALGVFASVTGLALIVGPALGGAIAQGLAWQWIFWVNLPIGLAVMLLMQRNLAESRGAALPLDLRGLALTTLAALATAWALVRGHQAGWTSPEVLAAVVVAALALAAFVRCEQRAAAPMVPLRLFRSPRLRAGIAASFLFYAPMYATVFFLPQFFQQSQAMGAWHAGLRLIPWTATLFVVGPLAGKLVQRFGERRLVSTGAAMQALGLAGLAWLCRDAAVPFVHLVPALLVSGIGVSLAMPAAQNAVLSAVAPPEMGKSSGLFNVFRYLGGVFGIALLVEVLAWRSAVGGSFAAGFSAAMFAGAGLSLAGALAGMCLPAKS